MFTKISHVQLHERISRLTESCVLLFPCSTFNWTVPFLSWLAITALCSATVLLYLIPLRYLVLAWGESLFLVHTVEKYVILNLNRFLVFSLQV